MPVIDDNPGGLAPLITSHSMIASSPKNAGCAYVNTFDWYRSRTYKLDEEDGYDKGNRQQAWTKAQEWGDRIPIGVIFEDTERPSYEEQVSALKKGPLVQQELNGRYADYEKLKLEFV